MNTIVTSTGGTLISFVLIFALGFVLSHFGKPYGLLLFNAHKLIALAFGIFLAVRVYRANQAAGLSSLELGMAILTVLLFLGLAVFGGLLSIDRAMPPIFQKLHHILPYFALASTIGLGLLMNR